MLADPSRRRLLSTLALAAALGAATGCDNPSEVVAARSGGIAESAPSVVSQVNPAHAPSPGGATASGTCSQYAEKLCGRLAKDSPLCQSTRQATRLLSPEACSVALEGFANTEQKLAGLGKRCDEFLSRLCGQFGATSKVCENAKRMVQGLPKDRCGGMIHGYDAITLALNKRAQAPTAEKTQ